MFVITGGGTGIGGTLAQALASRNEQVLIVGRRDKPLKETAQYSPNIDFVSADVSTETGREAILNHLKAIKQLKGLIHNAGTIQPITPLLTIDIPRWHQTMATNVEAPLFLTQVLSEKLNGGRVLNIGSGAAYSAIKGWAAYCVSKAALSMLTQSFQLEVEHIHFASVMPGIVDTDMQAIIRGADYMDEAKLNFFKRLKQNNQLVAPETVATFLSWLLLDIAPEKYSAQEWDIYDKNHHAHWLRNHQTVPMWDEA